MSLFKWPALSQVSSLPESSFDYQHGIYGKVDNAETDFRWLATSSSFTSHRSELHLRFNPRPESVLHIPLWWQFDGWYYASFCYPSAGADKTGRPSKEAQVLGWKPREGQVALGALALLTAAAEFLPIDWPEWGKDSNWKNETHIKNISKTRVTMSSTKLEDAAGHGIRELALIPEQILRDFYRSLLARRWPALLTGLDKPLGPQALAVLLLPLKPDECRGLCLAGWETEWSGWSGLACRRPLETQSAALAAPVPPDIEDRAALIAKAIRANDPDLAARPCDEVCRILAFARDSKDLSAEAGRVGKSVCTPTAPESELLEQALRDLLEAKPPDYLDQYTPEEVRDAYRRRMAAKAEVMKAWWITSATPDDLPRWFDSHRSTGDVRLEDVLRRWKNHPLTNQRLTQLLGPSGSSLCNMP